MSWYLTLINQECHIRVKENSSVHWYKSVHCSYYTQCSFGMGLERNKVEWNGKAEWRKAQLLVVCEAHKAIPIYPRELFTALDIQQIPVSTYLCNWAHPLHWHNLCGHHTPMTLVCSHTHIWTRWGHRLPLSTDNRLHPGTVFMYLAIYRMNSCAC